MGLDITFTRRKTVTCPKCNEVIGHTDVGGVDAGGRGWYPILKSLGYYVPYDQRTAENDWYGKDMVLTTEQADEVYRFVTSHQDLYGALATESLIAIARYTGDDVVLNADW